MKELFPYFVLSATVVFTAFSVSLMRYVHTQSVNGMRLCAGSTTLLAGWAEVWFVLLGDLPTGNLALVPFSLGVIFVTIHVCLEGTTGPFDSLARPGPTGRKRPATTP